VVEGDGVFVTIQSNTDSAMLARVMGSSVAYATNGVSATATSYEDVCSVPCNKVVDRNYKYVIQGVSGWGAKTSEFHLPRTDKVTLKVTSRSQGAYALGFLGGVLTLTGATVGATFWGIAASEGNDATVSIATTVVCGGLFIGSILLMIGNGTSVDTDTGQSLAKSTEVPKRTEPGFALTPSGVQVRF
jgi:hypothetical protein